MLFDMLHHFVNFILSYTYWCDFLNLHGGALIFTTQRWFKLNHCLKESNLKIIFVLLCLYLPRFKII